MKLDLKRKEQKHGTFYRMVKEMQKKSKRYLKKPFWSQITCTIINETDFERCQSDLQCNIFSKYTLTCYLNYSIEKKKPYTDATLGKIVTDDFF